MLNPAEIARHYQKFQVADRILLTGHSHQAWPDCALDAQAQAWLDAAAHVDDKWSLAFAKAQRVREGFRGLLDDPAGDYSLGPATHDLLTRWLSALPYKTRPQIVTTTSEFHSIRRQLCRLAEEGVEVICVSAYPAKTVGQRIADAVTAKTAAAMLSAVFYDSAHIAGGLSVAAQACKRHGAALLVDTYHALNVLPFSLPDLGLEDAFITGGGYKYCQLGEGNCFLRSPKGCDLRPVFTGWFADFSALEKPTSSAVNYAPGSRFEGATYDPTPHYRAATVFDFFRAHDLTPSRLRALSQRQLQALAAAFDAQKLPAEVISRDTQTPIEDLGGFLCLRTPFAAQIQGALRARGVFVDHRGDILRLGPAPYLTQAQLDAACDALGKIVTSYNI